MKTSNSKVAFAATIAAALIISAGCEPILDDARNIPDWKSDARGNMALIIEKGYAWDGAEETSASYSSGAGSSADTDSSKVCLFGVDSADMSANSEIADVIVVNAAMSEAEVAATETYLQTKWGTP